MKKIIVLLLISCCSGKLHSQEVAFGRKVVDTLTSSYFWGRGYTNDGMTKAASYLGTAFKQYGLQPMAGRTYLQDFSYPINTFPGNMELTINGKVLEAGKDFIVGPESNHIKGSGELQQKDSVTFINVADRFIVKLKDKLTMDLSAEVAEYSLVEINKASLQGDPGSYKVDIDNKFIKNFKASNVCAMVKGTQVPDSFIFITAHYDHLGGLGKDIYFPGANDNASGISLLLNLAHYYSTHPQRYSIGFICFAGEEAGLVGSKYFTEEPLIPLRRIRFLINTDLAGTGEEGITVVNATEFPKEFDIMNAINDGQKLLVKINPRGKAANSDHYFFTEKGVPAFFFYTMGGIKAYHDVFDKGSTLPMTEYEDLFKLVVAFNKKLTGD